MKLTLEDAQKALGYDGLVHLVRRGAMESLCGKTVSDWPIEEQSECDACRGDRRSRSVIPPAA